MTERKKAGRPYIDLTVSNPTSTGLGPKREALSFLDAQEAMHYVPSPAGLPAARAAIAESYQVDPDHLVLCASTSESYSWLFALLCDPFDQVHFPQPSYPLFAHLAGLAAVNLVPYPLYYEDGKEGFRLQRQGLIDGLRETSRAILVVNPNNPTGSYLHRDDLDFLYQLCADRGLALIVDEVFADYPLVDPLPGSRVRTLLADADPPCPRFVLSGFSKVLAMPQLKLGWIHTAAPKNHRAPLQERLELVADTFLSVNGPVQVATPRLLALRTPIQRAIRTRTCHNLHLLQETVQKTAAQLLLAEGGWYCVLQIPAIFTEEEWVLGLLQDAGVLVHPGYFFDFPKEAYLVLSLLAEPAFFQQGVTLLVDHLSQLSRGEYRR